MELKSELRRPYRNAAISILLQLLVVSHSLHVCVGYRYAGLYGILNEDPPSEPPVVDIHGAFELSVNVRFDDVTSSTAYETVIDFAQYNDDRSAIDNQIYFGKLPLGAGGNQARTLAFQMKVNRVEFPLFYTLALNDEGQVIAFTLGVTDSNSMYIMKNGSIVAQRAITTLPLPITYTVKNIGVYGLTPSEHFDGLIEGVKITLSNDSDAHQAMFLQNLPGQLVATTAFQMEMYVRFEDDTWSRWGAPIFEFSNGIDTDVISFYQVGNSTSLRFEITQNDVSRSVTAANCITINDFSLWQLGVALDGSMWIKKDHVEIANQIHNFYPTATLRRNMLIGRSLEVSADAFRGVILGLRLGTA